MLAFVEPRVRRVVAETLGVAGEDLVPEVSLTDELAADSLDLVEVALAIEADLGISVPERMLEQVRTYGDLVRAALGLVRDRAAATARLDGPPLPVWARLVRPGGTLERAAWLTPYVAETIAEDALRAGRGARLEVTVAAQANDAALARVREQLGWLAERGIDVSVARDGGAAAHAA